MKSSLVKKLVKPVSGWFRNRARPANQNGCKMNRIVRLRAGIDAAAMRGLEVGALDKPIVRKDEGFILYVDYLDTEGLKRRYTQDPVPDCSVDDIVSVDAVWGNNTIDQAVGWRGPLDYVIASHVGEHVPDFLSWLQELSSVLRPGGFINLALPDKRYCFDHLRRETSITDLLTAYFLKARRPQPQQIIDFCSHFHPISPAEGWNGTAAKPLLAELGQLEHAFAMAQDSLNGNYQDVHCWAFTSSGFKALIEQAEALGIVDLVCDDVVETEVNELEFFVTLRKKAA